MAYAVGQVPAGFGADAGGTVTDAGMGVVVPIPTVPGPSTIPWGHTWFSVGAYQGVAKLHYEVFNETAKSWRDGAVTADSSAGMVGVPLRDGDSIVALTRMPLGAGDLVDSVAVGWVVQAVLKA